MSVYAHELLRRETLDMWEQGLPEGKSTGWPSVDGLYTVAPAQWTLVTGTPNSGKSEWLDALMVNLARRGGWRFPIYSPENWPLQIHAAKIAEKYLGKPFGTGPTERMSKDELDEALEWMRGKFIFCKPERPDLLSILDEASYHCMHQGMTGVVIDPWNQLEHQRPQGLSETEYISQSLSSVTEFVRQKWDAGVHLWIVAHPRLMQKNKDGSYPIPRPYDVSGSAHWWNKSDNCITVWRDQAEGSQEVQIHVQKVRFKHIGRIGVASLNYDRITGRYSEQLGAVRRYADQYRNGTDGN